MPAPRLGEVAIPRGAGLDEIGEVFKAELAEILAEGFGGPCTPTALRLAREQFDTPAFRAYLAGKLGLL
jgi:hypothetical protein